MPVQPRPLPSRAPARRRARRRRARVRSGVGRRTATRSRPVARPQQSRLRRGCRPRPATRAVASARRAPRPCDRRLASVLTARADVRPSHRAPDARALRASAPGAVRLRGSHSARCSASRGSIRRCHDGAREERPAGKGVEALERDADFGSRSPAPVRSKSEPETSPGHIFQRRDRSPPRPGEPAHLADRPALLDEAPHDRAECFLLVAEGESIISLLLGFPVLVAALALVELRRVGGSPL